MDDLERKKKEILTPLFLESGAALMDCQAFEYGIALFLYHISRTGVPGLSFEKMQDVMEDVEKKTAGQLLVMLKKYIQFSDPKTEVTLQEALAARNKIIHRILIDNSERVADKSDRESLIKEIRQLRRKVRAADEIIRPIVLEISSVLDGLDTNAVNSEALSTLLKTAE